jgi:hypothetical protein
MDSDCATSTVHGVRVTIPEEDARTWMYMRSRISLGRVSRNGGVIEVIFRTKAAGCRTWLFNVSVDVDEAVPSAL